LLVERNLLHAPSPYPANNSNKTTQQQQPPISQANNNKAWQKGWGWVVWGGTGEAVSNVSLFTAVFDLLCYALKFSKLRCLQSPVFSHFFRALAMHFMGSLTLHFKLVSCLCVVFMNSCMRENLFILYI